MRGGGEWWRKRWLWLLLLFVLLLLALALLFRSPLQRGRLGRLGAGALLRGEVGIALLEHQQVRAVRGGQQREISNQKKCAEETVQVKSSLSQFSSAGLASPFILIGNTWQPQQFSPSNHGVRRQQIHSRIVPTQGLQRRQHHRRLSSPR